MTSGRFLKPGNPVVIPAVYTLICIPMFSSVKWEGCTTWSWKFLLARDLSWLPDLHILCLLSTVRLLDLSQDSAEMSLSQRRSQTWIGLKPFALQCSPLQSLIIVAITLFIHSHTHACSRWGRVYHGESMVLGVGLMDLNPSAAAYCLCDLERVT